MIPCNYAALDGRSWWVWLPNLRLVWSMTRHHVLEIYLPRVKERFGLGKLMIKEEKKMTTAGLEPATFWCRWRSKPNALPLRQVALGMAPLSFDSKCQSWRLGKRHQTHLISIPHTFTIIPAMALNWTMLNPDRTPVPLPRESPIMTVGSGAEVSLTIPDTPPTASATSGGAGGERKLKGTGKLFLTDQRVRSSY